MLIVTIETCTDTSTLGLVRDGAVLAEAAFPARHTLVRRLIPRLEWLLAEAGLSRADLQAVAVSLGPGSFTGVRIGLAAAKTLAQWGKIALAGIPTLEALAYPYREYGHALLVSFINARRQQVYAACFRGEGGALLRLTSDLALSADPFHEEIRRHRGDTERVLLVGQDDGIAPAFRAGVPGEVSVVRTLVTPHALAALAEARLATGETDDPMTLAPIYLRGAAD